MELSILSAASSLRWQLPVHTPSDEVRQDRMECSTIDATGRLVRETPLEAPKVAHVSRNDGGDQADPDAAPDNGVSISGAEAEGRAAVERHMMSAGG